jgi:hypothetical protein
MSYLIDNSVKSRYHLIKEVEMADKKIANPEKYTGKAFLTYDESIDFLGISLSTLTRYISDEGIKTEKFHRDKKRYLKIEDVKRIEDLIKNPWARAVPTTQDFPVQGGLVQEDETPAA